MNTLVARMPTIISNLTTYAASGLTAVVFVNTLAYPTKISFSRVQNVEFGAVISLERTSPPMAALEDVSAEELTTPKNLQTHAQEVKEQQKIKTETLTAGTRGYYQGYVVTRVLNTAPLQISRSNPEIQKLVAAAVAPAANPQVQLPQSAPINVAYPPKNSTPTTSYMGAVATPNPEQGFVPNTPEIPKNNPDSQDYKPALPKGHSLSGEIELGGGMAFVGGGQSLSLKRYIDGQAVEEGIVHIQQGTFEIRVAEKKGRLIAQMLNEKKEVLGEGAHSFENAPPNVDDHIKIKILAKSVGIAGQVISAYSYNDRKIIVTGAKLKLDDLDAIARSDEDGDYVFNGVSESSVALLRANAEGFVPSIQFVSGGQKNEVVMYPQKMVQSMVGLTEEKTTALDGVIWGKIVADGKPVAGATIELAGVEREPIYFNSLYLPDKRLKATGPNGIFAYLGILPGLHQLRATHLGKSVDGTIVPVASGYVSPIDLEIPGKPEQVRVGFADFTLPNPRWLTGILRLFGTEEIFDLNGDRYIPMSPRRLLSFFDGAVDNYYPGRILTTGKRDHIDLPMLQPKWLADVVKDGDYKIDPNKGAIILQADTPIESLSVNGRPTSLTDKDIIKIENKGLLLMNVTSGVNTVISKSAGKPDLDMNVVISDPGTVSVVDLRVVSGY